MNIIKHGNKSGYIFFTCFNCGCEYEVLDSEITKTNTSEENVGMNAHGLYKSVDVCEQLRCCCPDCGAVNTQQNYKYGRQIPMSQEEYEQFEKEKQRKEN